jgi:hypothetical protein
VKFEFELPHCHGLHYVVVSSIMLSSRLRATQDQLDQLKYVGSKAAAADRFLFPMDLWSEATYTCPGHDVIEVIIAAIAPSTAAATVLRPAAHHRHQRRCPAASVRPASTKTTDTRATATELVVIIARSPATSHPTTPEPASWAVIPCVPHRWCE